MRHVSTTACPWSATSMEPMRDEDRVSWLPPSFPCGSAFPQRACIPSISLTLFCQSAMSMEPMRDEDRVPWLPPCAAMFWCADACASLAAACAASSSGVGLGNSTCNVHTSVGGTRRQVACLGCLVATDKARSSSVWTRTPSGAIHTSVEMMGEHIGRG